MDQTLYDKLTAGVNLEEEDCCAAEGDAMAALAVPASASVVFTIVLEQLRELGCQYKDEIVATAKDWVAANVKRPMIAAFCNFAIDAAAQAICP